MWRHFVPSNLTIQTRQHDHSLDMDYLSNLPFLVEETLESQEEYPQEEVEEAEEVVEVVEGEEEGLQECPSQESRDKTPETS